MIAQVLKQMRMAQAFATRHALGPKPMYAKDLAPSYDKRIIRERLEFANWWTMLKSTLVVASPGWRAILGRLHEYPKHMITEEDLDDWHAD